MMMLGRMDEHISLWDVFYRVYVYTVSIYRLYLEKNKNAGASIINANATGKELYGPQLYFKIYPLVGAVLFIPSISLPIFSFMIIPNINSLRNPVTVRYHSLQTMNVYYNSSLFFILFYFFLPSLDFCIWIWTPVFEFERTNAWKEEKNNTLMCVLVTVVGFGVVQSFLRSCLCAFCSTTSEYKPKRLIRNCTVVRLLSSGAFHLSLLSCEEKKKIIYSVYFVAIVCGSLTVTFRSVDFLNSI